MPNPLPPVVSSSFSFLTGLALLLVLILLSAFFAASETGFLTLNRYRLKNASKTNPLSKRILNLINHPEQLLSTILIGNTFATTYLGAISEPLGRDFFGEYASIIGPACVGTLLVLCGEIIPKTIAAIKPEAISYAFYWPLRAVMCLLSPMIWISSKISQLVMRWFHIQANQNHDKLNKEELRTVVHEAAGLIPKQHQSMLLGILELEDVRVEHIMIPRNEVLGVDLEQENHSLLEQIIRCSETIFPIYRDDLDSIEGFVELRDCLDLIAENKLTQETLLQKLQEPYFIPEGTQLHTQLMNFQQQKKRMGLVVDEYGDIQGLVSLADILEEIVGEFTTHTDVGSKFIRAEEPADAPYKSPRYIIDGSTSLREINKHLEWDLPTEGPTTLNGLIVEQLESIPGTGIVLTIGAYQIEILETKDNLVKLARLSQITWQ